MIFFLHCDATLMASAILCVIQWLSTYSVVIVAMSILYVLHVAVYLHAPRARNTPNNFVYDFSKMSTDILI